MKFIKLSLIWILLSLFILTGCQPAAPQGNYTDDLGRKVQITGIPQRIISLAPSNTELVYALGLEDRLIGVTTYCNYPPAAKDKPRVSDFSKIDIEKVVSLQPDLILAGNIHRTEVIPALEKLGIAVLGIEPPTMGEILSNIKMLGQIAGKEQAAAALSSGLSKRITAVIEKTAKIADSDKPRTFFVSWHDPLWTAGAHTLINELIIKAGGTNIAADLSGHSQIDLESVIQRNPQIIFVLSSMGDRNTSFNYIKTEPRFQATDAVKNNRVYAVDSDIFARTTPRSIEALEQMARLMHPEIFK